MATDITIPNAPSMGSSSAGRSTASTWCPSDSSSRPASVDRPLRTRDVIARRRGGGCAGRSGAGPAARRLLPGTDERAAARCTDRRARAGDRVEDGRGVAHRARQHVLVGERAPVLAEVGAEGRAGTGRLQPHEAAHRSREANRAAHVVAVRDRAPSRPRPPPPIHRSIRPGSARDPTDCASVRRRSARS